MKTQNAKRKTLTLLLSVSLIILTNFLYSQNQSLVATKPIVGQGYLILDKMNNPNVSNWNITLIKQTFNSDGPINEIIEITDLPPNINYLYIPNEYRGQSFTTRYMVDIIGYGDDGTIVAEELQVQLNDNNNTPFFEIPNNDPYALTPCRKTCLSGQYAYTIQQYQKLTANLSRFQVEPAYKAFDPNAQTANPYYWYTNNDNGAPIDGVNKVAFVVSPPPVNITVKDPGGNVLTGLVFGYAKTLGVWKGQSIIATNGQHNIGNEFCSNATWPFNNAMNMMNASADFSQPGNLPNLPFLECIDNISPVGVPGTSDPYIGSDYGGSLGLDFDDWIIFCYKNGTPVPCETPPIISQNALNPEIVDLILINDLNNLDGEPIAIDVSDLYTSNGSFKGLNIHLSPSLYSFGFMLKEHGLINNIGELFFAADISTPQADMLDATIFPTPMTGDKYNIKMKAHATLKFDYELRDFTGNLLVSRKFVIHKDHEKTQKMNEKNIPEGFLVHRFIFEDGSVKTIQTQKQ